MRLQSTTTAIAVARCASTPQEADWGLLTMKVVERPQTRLAVIDLVLAV